MYKSTVIYLSDTKSYDERLEVMKIMSVFLDILKSFDEAFILIVPIKEKLIQSKLCVCVCVCSWCSKQSGNDWRNSVKHKVFVFP